MSDDKTIEHPSVALRRELNELKKALSALEKRNAITEKVIAEVVTMLDIADQRNQSSISNFREEILSLLASSAPKSNKKS